MRTLCATALLFLLLIGCNAAKKESTTPFPSFKQKTMTDCGPTCLRIICKYYGKDLPDNYFNTRIKTDSLDGSSLYELSNAADTLGFSTEAYELGFDNLKNDVSLPSIVHWRGNHFIVVYKILGDNVYVSDPADSLRIYSSRAFCKGWFESSKSGADKGVALIFNRKSDSHQ